MKIEWDCVRGTCLLFGPGLILLAFILATRAFATPDNFVRMLEARMGVFPGATRVLPECGCTVRYLGTAVRGRHYTVQLDRLD